VSGRARYDASSAEWISGAGRTPILDAGGRGGLEIGPGRVQDEPGDLRGAADAERVLGADALADGHQRPAATEEAAVEAAAVDARHQDRADERQAVLAAVVVPGEHQVDAPGGQPVELVGGVAEHDPQVGLGHPGRLERRAPRGRRPPQGQGRPPDLEARPAPVQDGEPRAPQLRDRPASVAAEVVVAQDRELARTAPDAGEHRRDPLQGRLVVDQVAGEDDQVGLPAPRLVGHGLEEPPRVAPAEVQVAQVHQAQAVARRGQAGHLEAPLHPPQPQGLVAGQAQPPRPGPVPDQGSGPQPLGQVDPLRPRRGAPGGLRRRGRSSSRAGPPGRSPGRSRRKPGPARATRPIRRAGPSRPGPP
jgi:hypothetical protein